MSLPTRAFASAASTSWFTRWFGLALLTLACTGCAWLSRWLDPATVRRGEIMAALHAHTYDVSPQSTLVQTFTELGQQTGVAIEWDPKLRDVIDQIHPRLPALRTLQADELLPLLREAVPPQALFDYEYGANRTLRLHLHYLPSENVAPPTFPYVG